MRTLRAERPVPLLLRGRRRRAVGGQSDGLRHPVASATRAVVTPAAARKLRDDRGCQRLEEVQRPAARRREERQVEVCRLSYRFAPLSTACATSLSKSRRAVSGRSTVACATCSAIVVDRPVRASVVSQYAHVMNGIATSAGSGAPHRAQIIGVIAPVYARRQDVADDRRRLRRVPGVPQTFLDQHRGRGRSNRGLLAESR